MNEAVLSIWIGIFILSIIKILLGFILYKFPPKINHVFGYRTKLSMKNENTWFYANKLSGNLLYKFGLAEFIVFFITVLFTYELYQTDKYLYIPVICLFILMITILINILIVEKKLKHFSKDNYLN